jgi:hypothetical protein
MDGIAIEARAMGYPKASKRGPSPSMIWSMLRLEMPSAISQSMTFCKPSTVIPSSSKGNATESLCTVTLNGASPIVQ